jgi:hypothetical protein
MDQVIIQILYRVCIGICPERARTLLQPNDLAPVALTNTTAKTSFSLSLLGEPLFFAWLTRKFNA